MQLKGIAATDRLLYLFQDYKVKTPAPTPLSNNVVINEKLLSKLKAAILKKNTDADADAMIAKASKGSRTIHGPKIDSSSATSAEAIKQNRGRREYLKRKHEEREYNKLVDNLPQTRKHDPLASMSSNKYVMSVGLNMIVAPISFGVFVYSFSTFMFEKTVGGENARVICGVLSGCAMLFIEMVLFVIRSDAMICHLEDGGSSKKRR